MFRMTVEDVFFIRNRGLVATGQVQEGTVRVGEKVSVGGREVTVDGIEAFRKTLDQANAGDNIGILFKDLTKEDVARGTEITALGGFDGGFDAAPAPAPVETTLAADQMDAMRDAGLVEEKPKGLRKWFGRGAN